MPCARLTWTSHQLLRARKYTVSYRIVPYSCLAFWSSLTFTASSTAVSTRKGKSFPYSLPSVGLGSWSRCTGSQPAGDLSHPPSGRLPLLSARPAVTFPVAEHHRPLAGTHFTVPRRVDGWVDLGRPVSIECKRFTRCGVHRRTTPTV